MWCALFLPSLPLDVFARAWPSATCARRFVVAGCGHPPHVVAMNAAARDAGIRSGQSITAALALAPDVVLREREPALEEAALAELATFALAFTPVVALAPPACVVADIGASLRLFGGLDAFVDALARGVEARGYGVQVGLAPTPLAAQALARARGAPVREPHELPAALAPLSLVHFDADPAVLATLKAAGVATFGEAAALPRDGVARRFGAEFVATLDRALGGAADPRKAYVPPPRFEAKLALPVAVQDSEALGFAVNRLVHALAGWLEARGLGVLRVALTLLHDRVLMRGHDTACTEAAFAFGAPARAPTHLHGVLRERLARLALPAPVEGLVLASVETAPLAGRSLSLLPGDDASVPLVPLADRLRARLGDEAVLRIVPHAEHRPEQALRDDSRVTAGAPHGRGEASRPLPDAPRPVWLLATPQPLGERLSTQPWVLRDGPERIESGWWDGEDIRRDYFVAETPDGEIVWIFRDHRYGTADGQWFVHGLFA